MMIYRSEAELRKAVAKALPDALRIEPGLGGQFGLPDFVVPVRRGLIPLECKMPNGSFTPNQRYIFRRMVKGHQIPVLIIYPPEREGNSFCLRRLLQDDLLATMNIDAKSDLMEAIESFSLSAHSGYIDADNPLRFS